MVVVTVVGLTVVGLQTVLAVKLGSVHQELITLQHLDLGKLVVDYLNLKQPDLNLIVVELTVAVD